MCSRKKALIVYFAVIFSCFNYCNATESVKNLKVKLNSGEWMPMIGYGTWQLQDSEVIKNGLDYALGAGYRHIDTAQIYGNEEDIGTALQVLLPKYNLTREDIFITSKINPAVPNIDGYQAVKDSLEKLKTDYIDLYLIHNPAANVLKMHLDENLLFVRFDLSQGPQNAAERDKKWQALVKAKKDGLVKSIGVSNYAVRHLKELLANDHGVKPACNQIQWNPFYQPRDILELCKREGIVVVGYSSLGSTGDRIKQKDDPRIKQVADKLNKTPSQVLLRWPLQEGIVIIPKSTSKKHIEENIQLDFVLPPEDVEILTNFEQKDGLFDLNNID